MLITILVYLAMLFFYAALAIPDNIPEYIPCESGWYYFDGKCYKKNGRNQFEKITWETARKRCKSYGGDLASIGSKEEQDFIFSFMQMEINWWPWIGLNDREKEGEYEWTDGTPFNYTNWYTNKPTGDSDDSQEDCGTLYFEPQLHDEARWDDDDCDSKLEQYICEMKSNPRRRSPNPMYCSSEAGKGWRWEDYCYFFVTEKESWQDAEKHCKTYYNGHLLSILDRLEDVFLNYTLNNISEEFWIGIKIQEQLQQKWSSGWYVSYDGLKKEIIFKDGTCVAWKKRKDWITIPCSKKLPFVCKVSKETSPVLKPPAKGSHCPTQFDGWIDLGGEKCYYFETETALSFYEALYDCTRKGGNLLSLHSRAESLTILPFVQYNPLGKSFYIGLIRKRPREEDFVWTDGSELDYENWYTNRPDDVDEKCVEAYTGYIGASLYTWNDADCDEKKGYICAVKKVIPSLPIEDENTCKRYCIYPRSYLFELVKQSPDAKELPTAV